MFSSRVWIRRAFASGTTRTMYIYIYIVFFMKLQSNDTNFASPPELLCHTRTARRQLGFHGLINDSTRARARRSQMLASHSPLNHIDTRGRVVMIYVHIYTYVYIIWITTLSSYFSFCLFTFLRFRSRRPTTRPLP